MSLIDNVKNLANNTNLTGLQKLLGIGKKDNNLLPLVNFYDRTGAKLSTDHRVRIKVPSSYITSKTGQQPNVSSQGIIFPYTPQITIEHKADYSSQNVTHSNFAQHFYQRSSVGTITITGKFTVQSDSDAVAYLSTIQLLRGLTKMLTATDSIPGSPPPVCRLFAYGSYIADNVPVAITSFRNDLPDNVDYFALPSSGIFNDTMVPIVSTIAVSLIPMYSRAEQQKFSVNKWLNGVINKDGYL